MRVPVSVSRGMLSAASASARAPALWRVVDHARPILLIESAILAVLGALTFGHESGWFVDFWNYYAAGERLNAGHQLYALSASDRIVSMNPAFVNTPSVQTPFMNLLWQPLAHLPAELVGTLWVGANVIAVLWVVAIVYRRGPAWAPLVVGAVAFSGGAMIAVGNVNGLLLAGYALVWLNRDRPIVGAIVGLMGAAKLLPATLIAFLMRSAAWRPAAIALVIGLALTVMAAMAVGPRLMGEYVTVLRGAAPTLWSASGLTGLTWLSPALGVALTAAAAAAPSRPAAFRLAVLASVIGGTAVGPATIPLLAAVAIPRG